MFSLSFWDLTPCNINHPTGFTMKQLFSISLAFEHYIFIIFFLGEGEASRWFSGEESTCNAGDTGSVCLIPGSGRSPRGEHANPLQNSCQKNHVERGAWWAMIHGFTKSQAQLKWQSIAQNTFFNLMQEVCFEICCAKRAKFWKVWQEYVCILICILHIYVYMHSI